MCEMEPLWNGILVVAFLLLLFSLIACVASILNGFRTDKLDDRIRRVERHLNLPEPPTFEEKFDEL